MLFSVRSGGSLTMLRFEELSQDADLSPMMNFVFSQMVQHPSQIESGIGVVSVPFLSKFGSVQGTDGTPHPCPRLLQFFDINIERFACDQSRNVLSQLQAWRPLFLLSRRKVSSFDEKDAEVLFTGDDMRQERADRVPALGELPVQFLVRNAFHALKGRHSGIIQNAHEIIDGRIGMGSE